MMMEEGAIVYINGHDEERCRDIATELAAQTGSEGRALAASADLSDAAQSNTLLAELETQGGIVNISSECAIKPLGQMVHYSVTKTALLSLSRALAELTKDQQPCNERPGVACRRRDHPRTLRGQVTEPC